MFVKAVLVAFMLAAATPAVALATARTPSTPKNLANVDTKSSGATLDQTTAPCGLEWWTIHSTPV
ncbi:hypothetical protein [Actinokineospora iranica]|uniref:hypothetical protein n=1 Tax=Actinokineospora iranica TaxID=1271860 RepID=UPI000B89D1E4|nr:hypothetical protein [Actinokineospora iranica]